MYSFLGMALYLGGMEISWVTQRHFTHFHLSNQAVVMGQSVGASFTNMD